MRPGSITLSDASDPVYAVYPVSYRAPSTTVNLAITAGTPTVSALYAVVNIYDYPDAASAAVDSAIWTPITDLTSVTAAATKLVNGSITALLFVYEGGTGSATFNISQPDSF
jgi:hypothetical protein